MLTRDRGRLQLLRLPSFRLVRLLLNEEDMSYDKLRDITGIPKSTLCRAALGTVSNVNEEYYRILYNLCAERELI